MDSSTIEELKTSIGERYDLEGFLAEGGMGAVYVAKNRSLGSRVAVKILPPEIAASPVRLARFKREAALAANLSHPHIVPVFEFDASHGLAYLIMPLVEGETLADVIKRRERLDWVTVHRMVTQIAGALGFAHSRNVVHRDIKPANILLEEATGRWLLTDFGVAHVTDPGDTEITRTGAVVGTPAYMTPEQRWGGTVDGRSDLYSLAAVAYQALCGTQIDRLAADLAGGTDRIETKLRQAVPRLSHRLASALAWPLALQPDERPESADEWLAALDAEKKRSPMLRWIGVAAAITAAIAAGWVAFLQNDESTLPAIPAVAVLPFQIDVRGDTNDLANVLPQAFDWQLQYVPSHRVLGTEVRDELQRRFGPGIPPPDTMLAVARRHGATLAIQGRALSNGDNLTISILVQNAVDGRRITDAESTGPADSLDALVSGIVIEAFAERMAREATGWASSLPHGLGAINAYVQGERDFRRGAYESAVGQFDEVIRLDSTFAPAYFKRMLSLMLGLRPTQYSAQLWSAFEAASEFGENLDPVSRQLLAGYELLLREGDVQAAEQALLDIVARYPRALEAWFLLGYVQFNLRAVLGTSLSEARLAFRRAVERDSSFAPALWHLALISVMEGDNSAAQDYLERFLAIDSTSLQAQIAHTYDSLLFRGIGSAARVLGSLDARSTGVLEVMGLGSGELRPPPGVRPIAREALRAFWENANTRAERQMAFRMRFAYLLARGQIASADTLLREAVRTNLQSDELDRWMVLSGITPIPDLADESSQAAAVERLQDAADATAETLWLAARWHQDRGTGRADYFSRRLAELTEDPGSSTPLARSLLLDIEARRHLVNGDTVRAFSTWEVACSRHSVDQLMFGLSATLWHIRVDHARLAYLSGHPETALRIAGWFDQMAGVMDQVAWPEILRIRTESARAINDLLLSRRASQELVELLADANGTGAILRAQAESLLVEVGGQATGSSVRR